MLPFRILLLFIGTDRFLLAGDVYRGNPAVFLTIAIVVTWVFSCISVVNFLEILVVIDTGQQNGDDQRWGFIRG